MTDRAGRRNAAAWGAGGWCLGVLVLLVAMPLAAGGRLPDRLATHWDAGSGEPDSSMPLWAATLFPALIWVAMTAVVAFVLWRARGSAAGATPGWVGATVGFGGSPSSAGRRPWCGRIWIMPTGARPTR